MGLQCVDYSTIEIEVNALETKTTKLTAISVVRILLTTGGILMLHVIAVFKKVI